MLFKIFPMCDVYDILHYVNCINFFKNEKIEYDIKTNFTLHN